MTAKAAAPRTAARKREIRGIMGLHLKPRYDNTDLRIVFDVETQRIIENSPLQHFVRAFRLIQSVTRPTYAQSNDLKVRFMWLDTDVVETFWDIVVATKQDREASIAGLKKIFPVSGISCYLSMLHAGGLDSLASHDGALSQLGRMPMTLGHFLPSVGA